MSTFYVHSKFCIPSLNSLLPTAVTVKAKWKFCKAIMPLFYNLQKNYVCKSCIFLRPITMHNSQSNGTSVTSISQVQASTTA
jgi:hypothetical protein